MGRRCQGAIAGVALVAAVAPAVAGADITVERGRVHMGVETRTVQAVCPPGSHVASGGVGSVVPEIVVGETIPVDRGDPDQVPDDAWQVRITNLGPDAQGITAFAVCTSDPLTYRTRAATATGAADPLELACPRRLEATAAGASTAGPSGETAVRASAPLGSRAQVVVKGGASTPDVTVAAVCANASGLRHVTKTFEVPGIDDSVGPEEVQCPAGRKVIGGGAYPTAIGAGTEVRTTDSFPSDGNDPRSRPDDVWLFTVDDDFGTTTSVRGVAVCQRTR